MTDKSTASLPLMKPAQVLEHFGQSHAQGAGPSRVLVEAGDFAEMLDAVGGFKIGPKALKAYSSARIGLVDAPVQAGGKSCYIFPDHFDRLGLILTLRQVYNLPLETIRGLLEHFPQEHHSLIIERKLEIEDVLDLAKMLKQGYEIKHLVMAKACDLLLEDLMSSSQTVTAALEPGDTLRRLQEKLLLDRLDEMKSWVSSGKWQEFLRRESAEDFKNLAAKKLLQKKIVRKVLARKASKPSR